MAVQVVKTVAVIAFVCSQFFAICLTLYAFFNFAEAGLKFSLYTVAVALAIDLAVQILTVVTMSLVQLMAGVYGTKLPLESSPLMQLSQERCELFYKVFYRYEPPNTLI